MQNYILVADDERNVRSVLTTLLESEGFRVAQAENGKEALSLMKQQETDLLVTDIRMPEMDGMELLRTCKDQYPATPVVMISAHGNVETAVEAMKLGALDFFSKPFENQEVLGVIKKALDTKSLSQDPSMNDRERGQFDKIVGQSASMQKVYGLIEKIARSDSTTLVLGESGTGKELVARTVHDLSKRNGKPFIAVNCAALPENLIESELFGHEKGAFTGASMAKPGRFELADKGTLFLDEIGEIPLTLQTKLLRALQEKTFERVGGIRSMQTDVRLVAATNRDLETEVKEGRFREDLYYRLNVVPISLPPLRERSGDVALLGKYFLNLFNQRMDRQFSEIGSEVMGYFEAYAWPGNVRELENTVERMVVLSDGDQLDLEALPERIREPQQGLASMPDDKAGIRNRLRMESDRMEKELLVKTLEDCDGNRTQAAKALGVSRKTIQNKIKEFGLK